MPNDEYIIQFDNRNQKNESKKSLEDYLNAELHLNEELTEEIHVQYFNSENNSFIQIADVFSNICYSYCFQPEKYNPIIKKLFENEGFTPKGTKNDRWAKVDTRQAGKRESKRLPLSCFFSLGQQFCSQNG